MCIAHVQRTPSKSILDTTYSCVLKLRNVQIYGIPLRKSLIGRRIQHHFNVTANKNIIPIATVSAKPMRNRDTKPTFRTVFVSQTLLLCIWKMWLECFVSSVKPLWNIVSSILYLCNNALLMRPVQSVKLAKLLSSNVSTRFLLVWMQL